MTTEPQRTFLFKTLNCDRCEIQPTHSTRSPESLTGFSVPLIPNTHIGHKREVGVFALCPVQFFLAHHMQNSESKLCRHGASESVTTALHTKDCSETEALSFRFFFPPFSLREEAML
jgi:hypothetical protein